MAGAPNHQIGISDDDAHHQIGFFVFSRRFRFFAFSTNRPQTPHRVLSLVPFAIVFIVAISSFLGFVFCRVAKPNFQAGLAARFSWDGSRFLSRFLFVVRFSVGWYVLGLEMERASDALKAILWRSSQSILDNSQPSDRDIDVLLVGVFWDFVFSANRP